MQFNEIFDNHHGFQAIKVKATFHILIEHTGKNSGHCMTPVDGVNGMYVRYILL
jgi:hypothetical protein